MVQEIRRSVAILFVWALVLSGQKVVLISFDGLGYEAMRNAPAVGELGTFAATAKAGMEAQGVQGAFPALTAVAHAAIWTGCYGDINNLTANLPPLMPRALHAVTERGNAFTSAQLRAEPIWTAAARQGVRSLVLQAPQAFPFTPASLAADSVLANGYQARMLATHAVVRSRDLIALGGGVWRLRHGPLTLVIRRIKEGLEVTLEGSTGTVRVLPHDPENEPPRTRPLARYFSDGLMVQKPVPAVLYFRLFQFTSNDFKLYVSPYQELAVSAPQAGLFEEAGGFIANGDQAHLHSNLLTPEEFLETAELVTRQMILHAQWLDHHNPSRLVVGYLPYPDEFEHEWLASTSERFREYRRWGYTMVDRAAREFSKMAGPLDDLIFVSDHGMAATWKGVAMGKVLRDAGLEGKAVHLYNSIIVNTVDWKGGVVPLPQRAAIVEQARVALDGIRDPATGQKVVVAFYTPQRDNRRFGIGGPAGGDLYFDLALGYRATDGTDGPVVESLPRPGGAHGFKPDRRDMRAVFVTRGPHAKPGTVLPMIRSLQIAPYVAAILGIAPPKDAKEAPPVAIGSVQ